MVVQDFEDNFTENEHKVWSILFDRQYKLLQDRAVDEILDGMKVLGVCNKMIPKFSEINAILKRETDFSIVPVRGFIDEELFFKFLSERKFPSTCFIRKEHELDYLTEPDIFHDIFGHVPLLVNPIFADFMQEFGKRGLEARELGLSKYAAALYWFTVEFGLINTPKGMRIYGAGIISSKGESIYSIDSAVPIRVRFDFMRAMKTQYETDSFQKTYFVINGFQEMFDSLRNLDWKEIEHTCKFFPDIMHGILINKEEEV
jgi:phenylalanine-4-hydroxylase